MCISAELALRAAVLVRLYEEPEKPGNALDFIKQYLGASVGVDVEGLRAVTSSLPLLFLPGLFRLAAERWTLAKP